MSDTIRKMKQIQNIIDRYGLLIVIFGCFFALLPLFHTGFFTMHDDQQIARLHQLDTIIKEGQFPPRWVPDLGFGFGYPLFNFYPPLVYYIGELFHLLGFSYINAIKMTMGLGFLLASIFMYLWVKNRMGSLAGIVAALLYTYAPYHAVDLYVRGALAEFFSFVWIPAVFWSLDKLIAKKNKKWVLLSSIFLAFVVLTHNLIALSFVPFLCCYLFFLLVQNKQQWKQLIVLYALVGISALGLSAYFWLPSLVEKQYTLVDTILLRELASYSLHFVYIPQLWSSLWGFGGSTMGISDGISFEIGKIQLIAVFGAVIFSFLLYLKHKNNTIFIPFLFILFLWIFSVFMTSFYAQPVWDVVKPFAYLQFPWRFLLFIAVFSAFLGGVSIKMGESFLPKKVMILMAISIILLLLWQSRNKFSPQQYLTVSDAYYITNQDIEWRVSKTSFEYMAKGITTVVSPIGTTQIAIGKNEIPERTFFVANGSLDVKEDISTAAYKKYTVNGTGGRLVINTYIFPGWSVAIDGKKTTMVPYGKFRLISIAIPKGKHTVEVAFTNTQVRTLGNSITLVTIVAFLGVILYSLLRRNGIIQVR